ncbi:MAG: DUF2075 domain-containing protein [Phycisphaerales bacterium]|nr:DUF2075 domain-containing protein [Phycisphaerales bacterium]
MNEVVGRLTLGSRFGVERDQLRAWEAEIEILRVSLNGLSGHIYIEFEVPRIGSRADTVLLIGGTVLVVEFKVGMSEFARGALDQVWDYALDLKNFHAGSRGARIVPIFVATDAPDTPLAHHTPRDDGVFDPIQCNAAGLRAVIDALEPHSGLPALDPQAWGNAAYRPTPTIVEAAQRFYREHTVDAIRGCDAGQKNLARTSECVNALIEHTRAHGQKAIAFVTGVPGAGKTLVGIKIASEGRVHSHADPTQAVYLSGNGPLVAVLREALIRDGRARFVGRGVQSHMANVRQEVKLFIQNVHHFRDEGLRQANRAPNEHVVIFDEAQRAWNREMTESFMKRKKGIPHFDKSEPEFLLSCMDRNPDWAMVICLVGGGQEINRGEAGIGAWIDAVIAQFPRWKVYASPELHDSEYAAGNALAQLGRHAHFSSKPDLHLAVSMRSFRAEQLSAFVKALLDLDAASARSTLKQLTKYPLVLSRDLAAAKRWIRSQARGTERYGLVASSEAQRLRPHAIDVRVEIDPVHYFLNDRADVRSSCFMEDAATEFQIQGLELDWACVTWDADLRHSGGRWSHHSFRGHRWESIRKAERQQYLKNAYRVLLTRARQGMVVFVPNGESSDETRSHEFYDETYQYLRGLGIPELTD